MGNVAYPCAARVHKRLQVDREGVECGCEIAHHVAIDLAFFFVVLIMRRKHYLSSAVVHPCAVVKLTEVKDMRDSVDPSQLLFQLCL